MLRNNKPEEYTAKETRDMVRARHRNFSNLSGGVIRRTATRIACEQNTLRLRVCGLIWGPVFVKC